MIGLRREQGTVSAMISGTLGSEWRSSAGNDPIGAVVADHPKWWESDKFDVLPPLLAIM
jgi:hypothetical protein